MFGEGDSTAYSCAGKKNPQERETYERGEKELCLSKRRRMEFSSQVYRLALDRISNYFFIAIGGQGKTIDPDESRLVDVVTRVDSFISCILFHQEIRKTMN